MNKHTTTHMKKTAQALQSSLGQRSGERPKAAAADVLVSMSTIMPRPRTGGPPSSARRYADRPSPPFPASSAPGMVHVGGDNQRWVSVALPPRKAGTITESPKVVYTWRRVAA
jgi:hypothetical protein